MVHWHLVAHGVEMLLNTAHWAIVCSLSVREQEKLVKERESRRGWLMDARNDKKL